MNVEAGKMDMETRAELQAKNFLAKYCKRISHWEDPLIVLLDKYSKETMLTWRRNTKITCPEPEIKEKIIKEL